MLLHLGRKEKVLNLGDDECAFYPHPKRTYAASTRRYVPTPYKFLSSCQQGCCCACRRGLSHSSGPPSTPAPLVPLIRGVASATSRGLIHSIMATSSRPSRGLVHGGPAASSKAVRHFPRNEQCAHPWRRIQDRPPIS